MKCLRKDIVNMIHLNIERYCDNCPYFEADVNNPERYYMGSELVTVSGNTNIFCAYRHICGRIYDYAIENHIKGEDSK